jgi:hypothetical protein
MTNYPSFRLQIGGWEARQSKARLREAPDFYAEPKNFIAVSINRGAIVFLRATETNKNNKSPVPCGLLRIWENIYLITETIQM